MTDDDNTTNRSESSISGRSAAQYFSRDASISELLVSYRITVRDFILVSFLSDQGPLSINQLARIVSMEPRDIQRNVTRLENAGLIVRNLAAPDANSRPTIRLTSRGHDIASRVEDQL